MDGVNSATDNSNNQSVITQEINSTNLNSNKKFIPNTTNPNNNVRSTIDTSIHTQYKTPKNNYFSKNVSHINRKNMSSPPTFIRNHAQQNPEQNFMIK